MQSNNYLFGDTEPREGERVTSTTIFRSIGLFKARRHCHCELVEERERESEGALVQPCLLQVVFVMRYVRVTLVAISHSHYDTKHLQAWEGNSCNG